MCEADTEAAKQNSCYLGSLGITDIDMFFQMYNIYCSENRFLF